MPIYLQKLQYYLELITFWQTKFNLVSKNSITNIWERHILDSLQLLKFINLTPISSELATTNLQMVDSGKIVTTPTLNSVTPTNNTLQAATLKVINNFSNSSSGKIIFDLGSGAGFPSVVLAIMDSKNTYYAIESNSKKCVFLQYVKRELQLDNFIVINMRIEDFILQKQPVNLPFINQNYQTKFKADSTIKQNLKAHIVVARALTSLTILLKYTEELLLPKGYGIFPKGISWQQELNDLSVQQQKLFTINSYNNLFSQGGKIIICQSKQ